MPTENEPPSPNKHYTREPWWVVLVAAGVMAILPLWKYRSFQRANLTGLGLPVLMGASAAFGAVVGLVLVMRSHIRSPFWSNVLLTGGIVLIAIGVSVLYLVFSA